MTARRAFLAVVRKSVLVAKKRPIATVSAVGLPLLLFFTLTLIAIGGGLAPTAVVLNDQGPYATAFVNSMRQANSFNLQVTTAVQADQLLAQGKIVAIVTIPADFDANISTGQNSTVLIKINNLDTDFTNDIRRGMSLALTTFYQNSIPGSNGIRINETDKYARDTSFAQYLAVGALDLGLIVGGLLEGGQSICEYWDKSTIKEILLSPSSRLSILLGELVGSMIYPAIGGVILVIFFSLIFQSIPANIGELAIALLLTVLLTSSLGILMGLALKKTSLVLPLAFGLGLFLYALGSPEEPADFGSPLFAMLARALPGFYQVGLFEHSILGLDVVPYSTEIQFVVLAIFAFGSLIASILDLPAWNERSLTGDI